MPVGRKDFCIHTGYLETTNGAENNHMQMKSAKKKQTKGSKSLSENNITQVIQIQVISYCLKFDFTICIGCF